MLNIKKYLPFLLLLALLTGCRYEDGPLVSFRSPWTRLTMHPKKITRLEMDGVDYLPMFNADFPNSTFRFTREGHWSEFIIYWSSDRFTEPLWAGFSTKFEEYNFKYIQLNFIAQDQSKPDVLEYVDLTTMSKYIYLLVYNYNTPGIPSTLPKYSIKKLTHNIMELEGVGNSLVSYNPQRHVTFKSL